MFVRQGQIIVLIVIILATGLFFIWPRNNRIIEIDNQFDSLSAEMSQSVIGLNKSPLSGLPCVNYQRRPLAVILAGDEIARPLSGLSEADLVLEMPVITKNITRLMAVYVCGEPPDIGSMRSARHDFIPLAIGLDAILAHWGGSHFALDKLNAGVMDNIDALPNPYSAFYQKKGILQPYNGFTSMDRLLNSAQKLGYRLENKFEGYSFIKDKGRETAEKILKIGYAYPYNVSYQYKSKTNSYLRSRANLKEIDKNNNQQITAKNVVVMRVFSRQIEGPYYNDLALEGKGDCHVYQNGEVIDCYWQKSEKNPESKLKFINPETKKEIPFVPGQTWIELVEPDQLVNWE